MNLPWSLPRINSCILSSFSCIKWYQRDERKKIKLPGHSFWSTIPQLCVAREGKATAQNYVSLALRISAHNVCPGHLFSHGHGDSVHRDTVTLC